MRTAKLGDFSGIAGRTMMIRVAGQGEYRFRVADATLRPDQATPGQKHFQFDSPGPIQRRYSCGNGFVPKRDGVIEAFYLPAEIYIRRSLRAIRLYDSCGRKIATIS